MQNVLSFHLQDVELVGDVDAMEVRLVGLEKVDHVTLSLGQANTNVEGINLK